MLVQNKTTITNTRQQYHKSHLQKDFKFLSTLDHPGGYMLYQLLLQIPQNNIDTNQQP